MSDTNSPGSDQGPGDTAWQEYLTGGGQAGGATAASGEPEGPAAPRRVIGTPSPAASHRMLPPQDDGGTQPPPRELPAGPEDPGLVLRSVRGGVFRRGCHSLPS